MNYWEKARFKQACKTQASLFYYIQQTQSYSGRLLHKCIDAYLQLLCLAHHGLVANSSQMGQQTSLGNTGLEDGSGTSQIQKAAIPPGTFCIVHQLTSRGVKMSKNTPMS